MNRTIVIALAITTLVGLSVLFLQAGKTPHKEGTTSGKPESVKNIETAFPVKVPGFSGQQKKGQEKFEKNCMACHGKHATGTGNGPPLLHRYYEPGHHGDYAFYRAAKSGVRAHHWQFGNMPPIAGASRDDVTSIISYVRALQRANGIY